MSPQISVLTSCYNASKYIREAVESILNQTFRDFEFILIDDGSTDNTLEILHEYARMDRRIVLVEKENTGLTDSLNIGLKIARGEWIARMDADDISMPTRLEKQICYVRKHSNVILLGAGCRTIDEHGMEMRNFSYPTNHDRLVNHLERGKSPFPHSSAIFKKTIVQSLCGYRNRLNGAEDYDLWLRMSKLGKIHCLRDQLILLRKHSGSITANNNKLVIIACAARVSHFLRQYGYSDPALSDDRSWRLFLENISRTIDLERYNKNSLTKSEIEDILWSRSKRTLSKLARLAGSVISNPSALLVVGQPNIRKGKVQQIVNQWKALHPAGQKGYTYSERVRCTLAPANRTTALPQLIVSILQDPALQYPKGDDFFSPSTPYPEYSHGHLSNRPNRVYDAVRRVFAQAGLDQSRYGTRGWNPLREFIQPGQQVFVLCNFVYQRRPHEGYRDFLGKCTHGSVIRAVLDYILLAVGHEGKVLFGNAPLQSCRWSSVVSDTGANRVALFYKNRDLPVGACDLRLLVAEHDWLGKGSRVERGDEQYGTPIDLGGESLLAELGKCGSRFRVTDYNPKRIEVFHGSGGHIYVINRQVLESDVIFSIPKLKTHEKVGITCAIKGCVGSVAHKDCLAHHRFGPPSTGGDEYPSDRFGTKRVLSQFHDAIQQVPLDTKPGVWLRLFDRALRHSIRPWAVDSAGAWSGNDTCWRMAVDLARVLSYADIDGGMNGSPVRPHLALIDGIIGGEGQGPLNPKAVDTGALIFGDNIVAVDYCAAILMGYDPRALPIVSRAAGIDKFRLLMHPVNRESLVLNGVPSSLDELRGSVNYRYRPPMGWVGRLEPRMDSGDDQASSGNTPRDRSG